MIRANRFARIARATKYLSKNYRRKFCRNLIQEQNVSPKRKFWGRTSRGHPGVIRTDIPAKNFGQGGQNPGKNKHFSADVHDPKARTSTTLRDFQKLRSKKLWAEFSFQNCSKRREDRHFSAISLFAVCPLHMGLGFNSSSVRMNSMSIAVYCRCSTGISALVQRGWLAPARIRLSMGVCLLDACALKLF